jgi:hypothetical protein
MGEAERRRANRLRVASTPSDKHAPPGLTGAEVISIAKLRPIPAKDYESRTEFAGGWRGGEVYGIGERAAA